MNQVPDGFLRFSDAVNRLAEGMWGGLQRPVPVATVKHASQNLSVGFGPWRERAGQRLRAASLKGELLVYVIGQPPVSSEECATNRHSSATIGPLVVPVNILARLITSRGGFPDQPISPSIKTVDGDEHLLPLLRGGLLLLSESDFKIWYRLERANGKWASQRSRLKIGRGRPTKQTEAIRTAVLALVRAGEWSGKASIGRLHRLLVAMGRPDVPSVDTLARLVDRLHRETGEPGLLRIARRRRKQT